jgi:hypothetical protein
MQWDILKVSEMGRIRLEATWKNEKQS